MIHFNERRLKQINIPISQHVLTKLKILINNKQLVVKKGSIHFIYINLQNILHFMPNSEIK